MGIVLNLGVMGFAPQRGAVLSLDTGGPAPSILRTSTPASIIEGGATQTLSFRLWPNLSLIHISEPTRPY